MQLVEDSMDPRLSPSAALFALAGPVAIGAAIGQSLGPFAAAHHAIALPATIVGVAALVVPALYIGGALTGAAPPMGAFASAIGRALRALGVCLLGFTPPAAFLVATNPGVEAAELVGAGILAVAAAIALRTLYDQLFAGGRPLLHHKLLYGLWSALTLIIGGLFHAGSLGA
ncbi:MAG TPA: hypothetical protein VFU21_18625 [Kofleriaceae bacterium]|nr:hypothetical protein [Kofleriaceae bacterium]